MLGNRRMCHGNALRPPCRSRCVDHIRQVVGQQRTQTVCVGDRCVGKPGGRRLSYLKLLRAHHNPRFRVGNQIFDALLGQCGIDRHVGRARLENSEHRDDELDRGGHLQRDHILGARPLRDEPAGEAIRALLQQLVGELQVIGYHGQRFGRRPGSRVQKIYQSGGGRPRQHSVRLVEQSRMLFGIEQLHACERFFRPTQTIRKEPLIVHQELTNKPLRQHICLVFEFDDRAAGFGGDRQRQRQLRAYRGQVELRDVDALQPVPTGVLTHGEAQPDQLVHPVVTGGAARIDLADHLVDTDILVAERIQAHLAYRSHMRGEASVRVHRRTQ
ncbi:Uncharacterised protein [Mycobacteroides abscessus]|nr:Uncharacterised protein [Mycobacteroides abscessus]